MNGKICPMMSITTEKRKLYIILNANCNCRF